MPKPFTAYIAFFLLLLFGCKQLFAQQLQQNLYLYEDAGKSLTPQQALQLFKKGAFGKLDKLELNKGITRSVFWLALPKPTTSPERAELLNIRHNSINRIFFYYVVDSTIQLQWVTGDYYPFRQRPLIAPSFYFPIDKAGIYLARIDKANETVQLAFSVQSRIEALGIEANHQTIMALFTGMILLLVIFGIYLFAISGDFIYLYYICYVSFGWLWVLSNAGYGFQYLWPNNTWFASKSRAFFAISGLVFSLYFLVKYIGGVQTSGQSI